MWHFISNTYVLVGKTTKSSEVQLGTSYLNQHVAFPLKYFNTWYCFAGEVRRSNRLKFHIP